MKVTRTHLTRAGVAVAAAASVINLALTITSDAQTGYDDLQAAVERVDKRTVCP